MLKNDVLFRMIAQTVNSQAKMKSLKIDVMIYIRVVTTKMMDNLAYLQILSIFSPKIKLNGIQYQMPSSAKMQLIILCVSIIQFLYN